MMRIGYITQSIIQETMGCSKDTAANAIREIKTHNGRVEQKGHRLCLVKGKAHPEWLSLASENQLLEAIAAGGCMELTGLSDKELPVSVVSNKPRFNLVDGLTAALMKCIICTNTGKPSHQSAIHIQHIDMQKNAKPTWLSVIPMGFEHIDNKTFLVAQEYLDNCFTVHVIPLTRIIDFKPNLDHLPKGLRLQAFYAGQLQITVEINHLLSDEQKKIVRLELGLSDSDSLTVERRSHRFAFDDFKNRPVNDDEIWPLLTGTSHD